MRKRWVGWSVRRVLPVFWVLAGYAACFVSPALSGQSAAQAESVGERSAALGSLLHEVWEDRLKRSPEFAWGGMPERANGFAGATDLAFAPGGRIFMSDGYGNARVLEYSADGKKRRDWASAGTGAGQFHLPHAVVVDENNVRYVADRENGRIEKFDLDGKFRARLMGWGGRIR